MGLIETLQPWTRQPNRLARIDPASGLRPEIAWNAAFPQIDLATNLPLTRAAGVVPVLGQAGHALDFTSSAAAGLQRSGGSTAAQTKCTFVVVFRRGSNNAFANLINLGGKWSFGFDGGGLSLGMVLNGVVGLNAVTPTNIGAVCAIGSHDTVTGAYWVMARDLFISDPGSFVRDRKSVV